ncbi:MAG: phosphopyruvate hydratase, partial [Candidatus Diapherotrites archaeon]|nr:phosphopyruvate hydratase [Candidatus Diapherotrites archaeon]
KEKIGANAFLSVSMACTRAGAHGKEITLYEFINEISGAKDMSLPVPFCNIINGGVHAGNELGIQEFMIAVSNTDSFFDAVRVSAEIYQQLKKQLKEKFGRNAINVGDEGGFAPPLRFTHEPIELILSAVEELGYSEEVDLALDAAASEFYSNGKYSLDGKEFLPGELADYYAELVNRYPIASMEDPFMEDDWNSFKELTARIGRTVQIVGDDFLVTNPKRIQQAIDLNACNALLLKVNQIGSVSEAIDSWKLASKSKWETMISHRSGESEDTFIADLAVGLGASQIKSGAPARGERTAKYNQLIRIEEELKEMEIQEVL